MTHRFPIKEIARQAGVGLATVDRVLNNRSNVSPQTKVRVAAAIAELAAQETQLAARGRRLFFDFVVEAPERFSREVQAAAQDVVPHIGTAVCRPRFMFQDIMDEAEVVNHLARIQKRGSHGVCIKVRDTAKIRDAVNGLIQAKIPVVTLVTDLTDTGRLAYVGLDNAGAGRTAAFLMAKTLGDVSGTVLATRSHDRFLGEEAREMAFVAALRDHCPRLSVLNVQGGSGVNFQTTKVLAAALNRLTEVRGVYSMGGGNRSILATLADHGLKPDLFIAHDLDRDNRALILDAKIDFVLHHDLHADITNAFQVFLGHHRLLPDPFRASTSTAQIITPANVLPLKRH